DCKKLPQDETPMKDLIAYGVKFKESPQLRLLIEHPVHRELLFFRDCHKMRDYNGPGRYFHAQNICNTLWRQRGKEQFQWHEWMEGMMEEYCETDEVLVTGPA